MLKAHLANIRSTSGLPKLVPFSLYIGGTSVRGGASSDLKPLLEGCGNGAERPRLVQTQCWCPQGRWLP